MTLYEKRHAAETILDTQVTWDGERGYFTCPLAALHTTKGGPRDSTIYLEGVPTAYCWHGSCKDWYENINVVLRSELDTRTTEEKARDKERRVDRRECLFKAARIKSDLEKIYEKYRWPDLMGLTDPPAEDFHHFLSIWGEEKGAIWVGEVYDTGRKGNNHFRTVEDWRREPPNLRTHHFTCASVFRPGACDRVIKEAVHTPYCVVEFDSLSLDKSENRRKGAALLNYIRSEMAGDLRMVVDSGNKSLHGWFLNAFSEDQRFILRQLGADPNTMRPSQPVRLPGAIRENGNIQSILWTP